MEKYEECLQVVSEMMLNGEIEDIKRIIENYEEKVSKRKEKVEKI